MPPQVRDIQSLIAQQNASLDPQYKLIDESINANEQSGQAQIAGLDATKNKAFKGIEQTASDKGMFFSGFSPNEQAEYTAGTYLPALAQLQGTIAQARGTLLGKKADLGKSAFDTATQMQESDRAVLNDWNKMTEQQRFQASESDKQRAFEANQREADRRAEASNAAASRQASAPKDISGIVNSIGSLLQGKVGDDGKVSPTTFQQGRQQWIASGGSPDSYNQAFYGYVNTSHAKDYF
jgi:hypothetical protein